MEKVKAPVPLGYAEAERVIRKIYGRFFELRQVRTIKERGKDSYEARKKDK